jgi:hypothetical protein
MTWLATIPATPSPTRSPTASPTFDGIAHFVRVAYGWGQSCIWSAHVQLGLLSAPSRIAHGAGASVRRMMRTPAYSRPCLVVRAAELYRFGSWGSNDCPADSARIVDTRACRSAATATGNSWRGNSSSSAYPKGCYNYKNKKYDDGFEYYDFVYYNHDEPSGDISSSRRPLCFAGACLVSGAATLGAYRHPGTPSTTQKYTTGTQSTRSC